MMAIAEYPRCAGYLKAMRFKLDDPTMTDYGWAVALSETWSEEFLIADGRVNFDTMDGPSILVEFERLLRDGDPKRKSGLSRDGVERLKAFLGSRGIKVSALNGADDYWHAASILWPHSIKAGSKGTLSNLLNTIAGMSKAKRQAARDNLHKVPSNWRAGGVA